VAIIDFLVSDQPQSVYLFPTPTGGIKGKVPVPGQGAGDLAPLYFQYWPQSLSDDYQVEYAEHQIPGGSHPLYQWVGGRGRTLSFEAIFTSEINENRAGSVLGGGDGTAGYSAAVANGVASSFLPSARYTVNVAAGLARIRSWMMPEYGVGGRLGNTNPPQILTLVFPNSKLGGKGGSLTDAVSVILRAAPITYESWFPDGTPRVATVALTFNEIVQTPSGSGQKSTTSVEFISRDGFVSGAEKYKSRGLPDRPWFGG